MGVGPVQCDRAAAREHEHDWLAYGVNALEKFFLRRRQIEAGAISPSKPFGMDVHLLALNARRKAENHDDEIGLTHGSDGVLSLLSRHTPHQAGFGAANRLKEFDLDLVSMALLEMHTLGERVGGMMNGPFFGDQLLIEPEAKSILTGETDQIVAGLGRHENTGPSH